MSTDTATQPATEVASSAPEPATEVAAAKPEQMFRYSGWVHVGPAADECEAIDEDKGTNDCSDPRHFHAWCRLPNQFQHREIREKALAAKARKVRQLRDEETDAHAILEDSLDQFAHQGDEAIPVLVEELLGKDWWQDYLVAAGEVQEREEGVDDDDEPVKPFAHIEEDQRRHAELKAMPEDDRPADEYEELTRHLARYAELVKERQDEIREPKKQALVERGINGLLDLVRDQRINAAGTDEFMHIYSTWTWLVGTLEQPGGAAVWAPNPAGLVHVAPEVLEAVKELFDDLEATEQRAGNA